jgi:hypothetical protein
VTATAACTQATLRRHIEAARKAGLTVFGIRPDGTLLVSDGDNPALDALRGDMTAHDTEVHRWAIRE